MNLGFPNLKQIFFTSKVSKFRTKSVNRNSIEPKQETILSIDAQTPNSQTSPLKSDIFFHREVNIIQQKLDSKEIELKNLKTFEDSNLEYEFKHNIEYLNEISLCVRQKDLILAKAISRGVVNCEKIMSKLLSKHTQESQSRSIPLKVPKTDEFSQTDEEKFLDKPIKFCTTPELESFKQLGSALKKIKVSRLTGQLCDLYDSLSRMYIEVPEPSTSPEPQDLELSNPNQIMHLHLNVIKKNINHLMSSTKAEAHKRGSDKGCQDDFPPNNLPQVKALEHLVVDKEFEVKKMKKKLETETGQKKGLEESIVKMRNFYGEFEKKHNEIEIEAVQLKNKNNNSESLIISLEKRTKWLDSKLENKTCKLHKAKERRNELKKIIVKKQKDISKLQDDLYTVKIHWKITEEKLSDIEKVWEKRVGSKYQYKEISMEAIVSRFKIVKDEIDDANEAKILDEMDSDVSGNENPENDDLDAMRKSRENLLYVENLKIAASSKNLEDLTPRLREENGDFASVYLKKNDREKEDTDDLNEDSEEEIYALKQKERKIKRKKNPNQEEGHDSENSNGESGEGTLESLEGSQAKNSANQSNRKKNTRATRKSTKKKTRVSASIDESYEGNTRDISESYSNSKQTIQEKFTKNEAAQSTNIRFSDRHQTNLKFSTRISSEIGRDQGNQYRTEGKRERTTSTFLSDIVRNNNAQRLDSERKTPALSYEEDKEEDSAVLSGELQRLLQLEKEINNSKNLNEKTLVTSFKPEQQSLFENNEKFRIELEKVKKLINLLVNSKKTQCCLYDPKTIDMKGQTIDMGITSSFQSSDIKLYKSGSKIDVLAALDGNTDAKNLLKSIFKDDSQIEALPLQRKIELLKSLQGHKDSKCKEMCPHLLRVMRIKWKIKGQPYPIRNILLRSVEF